MSTPAPLAPQPCSPLMRYLNRTLIMPVLNANADDYPRHRTALAALQADIINLLYSYNSCTTPAEMLIKYMDDLNSRDGRALQKAMASLGFATPADENVLCGFLELAYAAAPEIYLGQQAGFRLAA